MMATHLENLEKILVFILRETSAKKMIDILYEKIKFTVEEHIILRDIENFIAYFKFLLSVTNIPQELKFELKLIQAFIDRTYVGFSDQIQKFRARKLYTYLKKRLHGGAKITDKDLELLEKTLKQARKPSLEKLMEHIRVAMILKWLQGPLKDQLSMGMKDYVIFLATAYGQYEQDRVFNIEWQPYNVSKKDMSLIIRDYTIFEISIIEAMQAIRKARASNPNPNKYREQFRIVLVSLDNLVKMTKKGELDSVEAFKDKIIVSTALIYIQDEFVKKDPELKKLTQLFVSLYYQFRDKHYVSAKKIGMN